MPKKILVIEDEPGYQDLMKFVFKDYDLSICGAIEDIEKNFPGVKFDLIICDINLGGASGFEYLVRMRREGVTENLPFILWSSSDTPENREKAAELGAAGFLSKPFKTEAVQQMVALLLQAP
ncbi:MAG: response regulator [Elusimicrobia bacterium]|nr:response regulator [Elusimicrobiota bacterium]